MILVPHAPRVVVLSGLVLALAQASLDAQVASPYSYSAGGKTVVLEKSTEQGVVALQPGVTPDSLGLTGAVEVSRREGLYLVPLMGPDAFDPQRASATAQFKYFWPTSSMGRRRRRDPPRSRRTRLDWQRRR